MLARTAHADARRGRSGITLTEILISIMIMGVGVISLATLFPLGLRRLQNAQRMSRSTYLAESAAADLSARNLLAKFTFQTLPAASWYAYGFYTYDPWLQDTPSFGQDWAVRDANGNPTAWTGVNRSVGQGLPVAYDPLWRAVTFNAALTPPQAGVYPTAGYPWTEARLGNGIGFLRNDPNPGGTSLQPSAHGLPRVSNLPTLASAAPPVTAAAATQNYRTLVQTFVSPEDLVLADPKGEPKDVTGGRLLNASPVVPEFTINTSTTQPEVLNDWRYSWLFTGQQSDVTNGTVFDGDIVVHENRQFSVDTVTGPFGTSTYQVGGESVVEAVWGYSTTPPFVGVRVNFSNGAPRSVLLRWPAGVPDPDVRVGGWIADVTYERWQAESVSRSNLGTAQNPFFSPNPLQRCAWYQVAKKSEAQPALAFTDTDNNVPYRSMTVWLTTPVRYKTPINFNTGFPYHVEAALIAPTVVNVFPRTVYTR